MSLLLWTYRNEEEENSLVGWPPIKSWRKKELHQQHAAGGRIRNNRMQANENHRRGPNSFYVKVNMEGVTIGRKVDLRLYNSYQTLTNTLISMFAKCKWWWVLLSFSGSLVGLLWGIYSGFDFCFGFYTLYMHRPKFWGRWSKLYTHLSKRTRRLAACWTCSMAVCAYVIFIIHTFIGYFEDN